MLKILSLSAELTNEFEAKNTTIHNTIDAIFCFFNFFVMKTYLFHFYFFSLPLMKFVYVVYKLNCTLESPS